MVERARSFVDSDDRALRAAARKLVGLEDAAATEAREGQPFVEPVTQMTFVWVPGGSFVMGSSKTRGEPGYDPDACDDEMLAHPVRLTGFWMGVYPVTNEQYTRFMAETGQPAPPSFSDRRFNDPAQPVVTVSWEDAAAFARWLTGKLAGIAARLPTEAEWEYAARGTDGRRYPWGNERPDGSRATLGLPDDSGRPAVVGHTPGGVSPFGVHDLAGNVWEWCLDAYAGYAEIEGSVDLVIKVTPAVGREWSAAAPGTCRPGTCGLPTAPGTFPRTSSLPRLSGDVWGCPPAGCPLTLANCSLLVLCRLLGLPFARCRQPVRHHGDSLVLRAEPPDRAVRGHRGPHSLLVAPLGHGSQPFRQPAPRLRSHPDVAAANHVSQVLDLGIGPHRRASGSLSTSRRSCASHAAIRSRAFE